MLKRPGGLAAIVTLILSTILHAFTHAYGAMLLPMYLLIRDDLKLPGVRWVAMLVTIYGMVYALLSYPAGVLADRFSRKSMLGYGLLLNATVIVLMGLTRRYDMLMLLAVMGGVAGTVFHPAANALVPEHFPRSPGMAIGLLGIGSGLGFFAGPRYAGWSAEHALWHWGSIASWQRPCIEMGGAGLVVGLLFLLFSREARGSAGVGAAAGAAHPKLDPAMRNRVIAVAIILGCRDFAGVASLSLASIYLLKALNFDPNPTGLMLGAMMLMGVVANPLAVWLTPGRRRLPWLTAVLVLAGLVICLVPFFTSRVMVLTVLCLFEGLQLGSYAMSDAAMLERVPAIVRGRVVGLFLSIAGTFAGTSPWLMGLWTDALHEGAKHHLAYIAPFATLGGMMIFAAFSTPIIARLGVPQAPAISPLQEIVPATLEPVM